MNLCPGQAQNVNKVIMKEKQIIKLPIPDDPRKRKTRGCSSSYHPFSRRRTAEKERKMK